MGELDDDSQGVGWSLGSVSCCGVWHAVLTGGSHLVLSCCILDLVGFVLFLCEIAFAVVGAFCEFPSFLLSMLSFIRCGYLMAGYA